MVVSLVMWSESRRQCGGVFARDQIAPNPSHTFRIMAAAAPRSSGQNPAPVRRKSAMAGGPAAPRSAHRAIDLRPRSESGNIPASLATACTLVESLAAGTPIRSSPIARQNQSHRRTCPDGRA